MRGRRLNNRYELLEPIGAGGMGEVWRAHDRALDREVAVKVFVPPRGTDEERDHAELLGRFRREARSAAALDSPHIVAVHDHGTDDSDGGATPFLVMALVRGPSLHEVLRDAGRVPLADALRWCADVCRALRAAHGAGVVHRDIKPANIMVEGEEGETRAKVVDFGIAKFLEARSSDPRLTTTGAMPFGSVLYMAPEQFRQEEVDGRTDLYALGCVLYELLVGRPPYTGSAAGVMYNHLNDVPLRPSRARAELSPAVDRLVLSLMARDPGDRPSDAAEALARIEETARTAAATATAASPGAPDEPGPGARPSSPPGTPAPAAGASATGMAARPAPAKTNPPPQTAETDPAAEAEAGPATGRPARPATGPAPEGARSGAGPVAGGTAARTPQAARPGSGAVPGHPAAVERGGTGSRPAAPVGTAGDPYLWPDRREPRQRPAPRRTAAQRKARTRRVALGVAGALVLGGAVVVPMTQGGGAEHGSASAAELMETVTPDTYELGVGVADPAADSDIRQAMQVARAAIAEAERRTGKDLPLRPVPVGEGSATRAQLLTTHPGVVALVGRTAGGTPAVGKGTPLPTLDSCRADWPVEGPSLAVPEHVLARTQASELRKRGVRTLLVADEAAVEAEDFEGSGIKAVSPEEAPTTEEEVRRAIERSDADGVVVPNDIGADDGGTARWARAARASGARIVLESGRYAACDAADSVARDAERDAELPDGALRFRTFHDESQHPDCEAAPGLCAAPASLKKLLRHRGAAELYDTTLLVAQELAEVLAEKPTTKKARTGLARRMGDFSAEGLLGRYRLGAGAGRPVWVDEREDGAWKRTGTLTAGTS
ncbi:protein kinase domain-containing protein [Streptomyces albus]|uniref:protein kinase domain-containing protein n=1 Tax=Streptomyces albus TaxID=1888 RepID=UPI0014703F11|nr:protein kinase [Streptomyces albus]